MKWFKKKQILYTQSDYKLLIINEKALLLHEIFGISDERADHLVNTCIKAYHKNNQLHTCLVDVIDACVHTNEIVFTTMIISKVNETSNSKEKLSILLKNLFNND